MAIVREPIAYTGMDTTPYFLDILSQSNAGTWVLSLPPRLKPYQNEMEALIGKVFAGRPRSMENLELAQQMTLNWCISKCRKLGITIEESFQPLS